MEADLDSFFDVAAIRSELEARRARLESEMASMQRIQEKVRRVNCIAPAFRLTRRRSSTKSMSTCAA
jgi:hypothetical protein